MKTRVKEVLKKYKISQTELAEKLGITLQSVNSRLKNPTVKSLSEFSKAIGCQVTEFFEEDLPIQLIYKGELHTFYSLDEFKNFADKQ
ncbi:helix-turn-helix transcriptional regulator [Tenacibaculum maritimum]|uniref:helix-turn-helix transcriptional regulator n=1 Tax=Tenacibaculum maritimum TaxID=107401 RepID=UPI0012E6724F|nr:helix-turn-helix transcriptional regulator [Tenacibaculum maritimum]CAA0156406.1 Transcriptional regulator (modular protein) [Tenacibaculum maritimum]CAA0169707.1 putative transcriptional regulator [Tenacibaculum maritimum]CAA0238442.1 Transcriptional regulator (modular protein) [Tenacibaculum maritimum]